MTEREAIKEIENDLEWHSKELKPAYKEVLRLAIKALEEMAKINEVMSDFRVDCGSTSENVKEIWHQLREYLKVGTVEEFRTLKDIFQITQNLEEMNKLLETEERE